MSNPTANLASDLFTAAIEVLLKENFRVTLIEIDWHSDTEFELTFEGEAETPQVH